MQRSGERGTTRGRARKHTARAAASTHSPRTKTTTQRNRRKHHRGHAITPRIHHHAHEGTQIATQRQARHHTGAATTHRIPKPPRRAAGASRATAARRKPSAVCGRNTEVTIQHTNIEAVTPHTNTTSAAARASAWRGKRGDAVGVCKRLYHPPYPSRHCSHWERE